MKVFEKYQSTVREALDQQLIILEERNSEPGIKMMIQDLLIHVENKCRKVHIDPFSLSDEVFTVYNTEYEGESDQPRKIIVKMENPENQLPKEKITLHISLLSDDEDEVEEE